MPVTAAARPVPRNGGAADRVVVALVPDAYGGRGGIAQYNRHFLKAICAHPTVEKVVALPRVIRYELEDRPKNLDFVTAAAGGRAAFTLATLSLLPRLSRVDLIVCTHLHLLPFAKALQLRYHCPVVALIYGIEAWEPTRHPLANRLCRNLDGFIAIRRVTAERFIAWARPVNADYGYLPNCIEPADFGLAAKRPDLIERYGLRNMKVVMTAGRMDYDPTQTKKGFEEVLRVLPKLAQRVPNIRYLVMGDGDDIPRLEGIASSLRVRERLIFTGYVPDSERADHYRLADVFAMPGSSPHFDTYPFRFVFLEALACGVPVVGSRSEDSAEATDPDVLDLITQVDPNDNDAIVNGIISAMAAGGGVKMALSKFYYRAFEKRAHDILDRIWNDAEGRGAARAP